MRLRGALLLMIAVMGLPELVPAQMRTNPGFRAKSIPANDDGSAPLEPLGFTLNFFGRQRDSVFVNNNGNVTFDSALVTYTPFGLTGVNREIIAPFFADVDTRAPGSALVTYGTDTIDGKKAFGANWSEVGYFAIHADKLNRFQLVLIERADTGAGNFDIEFNYERIVWETGDASGGTNGFGGVPASAGWSNGSGLPGTSYELPGSLIPGAFLDSGPYSLVRGRTPGAAAVVRSGRWLYRARGGTVIPALTINTGCPIPNATAGRLYAHQFEAVGSRPPYRWSVQLDPDATLPNLSMNANGILTGTPARPGEYAFTVRVTAADEDGDVTVSRRCGVTVDPPTVSILTNAALPGSTVGSQYQTRLRAEGGGGPFRFDLKQSAGVPGLTLNPNGTLSGVPSTAGNYQLQVVASSESSDGAIPATKRFGLSVASADIGIRAACPLPNGTGGVPYSYQFNAQGGAPPYRWSVLGALPTGISLTPEGLLNGLPRVPHWWPFTVKVEDSRGAQAQLGCGVVILFPEVRVTSSCPLPAGSPGTPYSQQLQAAGGTAPYNWAVIGNLPTGLRLSADGVLSGAPLAGGVSQFSLKATDGRGQTAASPCSLSIAPGEYGISSCPLPNAYAGEPYSQQLFVNGGAEPYLWSQASPLPPGLRISPSGSLSGTLNTAGSFPVPLRVTDATGRVNSRTCNLTVLPQTLRVTSACPLPAAAMGQDYAARLGATGGTEPYSFSIRGDLPPGVRFAETGVLSGVPTQAGVYPVELTVRDRGNQRAVTSCAIGVDIPSLPDLKVTGLPAVVAPASTGPRFTIELGAAYPLAVDGEVTLTVTPDTTSNVSEVNRPDPSVRFSNGQRVIPFTFAPGARSVALQISSTGTVASTWTVTVSKVTVAGVEFARRAAGVTKVSRLAPVLTNVCYAPNSEGFDVDISGYSTTRDLTSAELVFGSNSYTVDLTNSALEYFAAEDSVRTGGTFRVRAPYRVSQATAQALGQGTAVIRNSAGASPSRSIQRCQ